MIISLREKITKTMREAPSELARFARGGYPSFVLSSNPAPLGQEAPVFMFHDIQPERFESQLRYLKANNYKTLTIAEFMEFLNGNMRLSAPSVLLTFDDGHKSWKTTAWPLLRKYDFSAVGFLVSSLILNKTDPESPWLSWQEVREIEKSGSMSFESHTAFHDRVFTDGKLLDFVRPGLFSDPLGLDAPWVNIENEYTNQLPPGTPVYSSSPRLAGLPRMLDDMEARKNCVQYVADNGGLSFFQESNWRAKLREAWNDAAINNFESIEEQRVAISHELLLARTIIEEQLQREIRYLCYPWGIGSEMAISLSRETGYKATFSVAGARNSNQSGDSPWETPRLKDDYIFRLPGKGRFSLRKITFHKIKRRLRNKHIY